MEPEKNTEEASQTEVTENNLNKVTPLSKYLAMTLFVILPFVGIPLWFVIIMATFAISVISIYTSYCDLFYSDSDEQVVHNDDSSSSMIA